MRGALLVYMLALCLLTIDNNMMARAGTVTKIKKAKENLALHRPTFTHIRAIDSIISFAGKANRPDKLVDGDQETCILEPYVLKERWWTVELDQHYQVDTIVVYHNKFNSINISIDIGDTPATHTLCDFYDYNLTRDGLIPDDPYEEEQRIAGTLTCSPPIEGRYVTLSDYSKAINRFCDIEVYARNSQVAEFNVTCGVTLTDAIGQFQSVDNDGDGLYETDIDCWWLISTDLYHAIELNITHMDIEDHAICGYDFLKVYDGAVDTFGTIGIYCGTEPPGVIISKYNLVYIHFHSDESLTGSGFLATYFSFYLFGCGGIYENSTGELIGSPVDHPDVFYHDSSITCTWVIIAGDGLFQVVELYSVDMTEIEGHTYDQMEVKIYDGKIADYALLRTYMYSLNSTSTGVTSTSRIMFVQFQPASVALTAKYSTRCAVVYRNSGGLGFSSVDSDGDGLYEHNANCSWTIITRPHNIIHLFITYIAIQLDEECKRDFIKVFDGNNTKDATLGTYCGYVQPPVIISSANTMHIQFVSDESINEAGFRALYKTFCQIPLTEPSGSFEPLDENQDGLYDEGQNCTWIITVEEGKSIQLNITDIDIDESMKTIKCVSDYITVYDDFMTKRFTLDKICGVHSKKQFISSYNRLYILFHSDQQYSGAVFHATYTAVDRECGTMLTDHSGWFVAPDEDNDGLYDANVDCKWIIYVPGVDILRITIQDMDIQHYDNCELDYLEVFSLEDGTVTTEFQSYFFIGRYCGADDPPIIEINNDAVKIDFHSSAMINGAGFNVSYVSVDKTVHCGSVLNEFNGWITSEDQDNDGEYDHNLDCLWTIFAAPNNVLLIRILNLDIEWTLHCEYDYLKVYELDTESEADHICGQERSFWGETQILSVRNVVYVRFVTDWGVSGSGFKLFYTQGPSDMLYDTELLEWDSKCVPKDQDLDGYYDDNQDILWYLRRSPGSWMKINLVWLDIQYSEHCQLDYIEVYDEVVRKGKFCGTVAPPTMIVHSQLHIHFHSDEEISGTGFNITYSSTPEIRETCSYNDRLTMELGSFVSFDGDDDGFYDYNLECRWTLEGSFNDMVKLHILGMDIQYDDSCRFDYLEVSEPGQADSSVRYCGTVPPPLITSTFTSLIVHFVTDASINGYGFNATYWFEKVVCGGVINDSRGTIRPLDRNGDGVRDNNQDCWWSLALAEGQMLELNFVHIRLYDPDSGSCQYSDYIEVYENGTSKALLCGILSDIKYITSIGFDVHFKAYRFGDGVGFLATYVIADVLTCGADLSGNVGWIGSPDSDGDGLYDNNMFCTWTLFGDNTNILEIYVSMIDVECGNDYLKVQSKILCGEDKTYEMIFKDTQVEILFFSDPSINGEGFILTYNQQIDDCNQTCGGELSGVNHYFSPLDCDGDGKYDYNLQCLWNITVENHQKVRLIISDIHIQEGEEYACVNDYLQIYDGRIEDNNVIGTYCGHEDDIDILATQSVINVYFSTDYMTGSQGFNATFMAEFKFDCGSIFTDSFGQFKPDDLDGDTQYDNNLDCLWIIRASENKTTYVQFYNFDIERGTDCNFDYLKVYETRLDESTLQGTYCGYFEPPMLTSQQDLFLRFHSDFGVTGYGFLARFHIFAGSTFPAESSTVISSTQTLVLSTETSTTTPSSLTSSTKQSSIATTLKTASTTASQTTAQSATTKAMSITPILGTTSDVTDGFVKGTYEPEDITKTRLIRSTDTDLLNNTTSSSGKTQNASEVHEHDKTSSFSTANWLNFTRTTISEDISTSDADMTNLNSCSLTIVCGLILVFTAYLY